jgi:hypothetical protein
MFKLWAKRIFLDENDPVWKEVKKWEIKRVKKRKVGIRQNNLSIMTS